MASYPMDSTSSTTQPSRSPSPSTPEPSDILDPITIQSELDLTSSWYLSGMHTTKDNIPPWSSDPVYTFQHKTEDDHMLRLDELIEQHAYDESPPSEFNSSLSYSSPPSYPATSSPPHHTETVTPGFRASHFLVPSRSGPVSLTRPIPPPASLPRKQDPSTISQKVVHPPKDSCFNLPIMFPSIPEGGTKSRVETQIRVTIDLADSSSSSDPFKYNRVGSWKWLKLPPGTTTKKRTRKQGKIDPEAQDVLHLITSVTCASSPHSSVVSCSSCQAREAKRVAKKLAARVRPARSDSDSEGEGNGNGKQGRHSNSKQHEDTTSIIQFNCAEILDFSTGTAVLPLRLTCYCRHHREKVGFTVHFSMLDNSGRVVGTGMSRPIMITDDHKTSSNKTPELINNLTALDHPDWSQIGRSLNDILPITDLRAPSKRREVASITKKRPKPYDSNEKPNRLSREGSVTSHPSPSAPFSPLPTTRDSTPSPVVPSMTSSDPPGLGSLPPLHHPMQGSETSSPDSLATPLDQNSDIYMPELNSSLSDISPTIPHSLASSNMMIQPALPPMSFMFFGRVQSGQGALVQTPTIHRLIPNMGPTHGGIEVTVLGANFHPSVQLDCVFGDVTASSTQRWSDNTLVCVLPPRATPGVVAVWFKGFPKTEDQINPPPSLFTYSDESDRALMELALQVVGLKMTGKIEDAKNVAMRIVGNAGGDGSDSQGENNNIMQLASPSTTRDLRPLLFARAGEIDNFESLIVDFLAIINTPLDNSAPDSISTLDAISHASASGQTLLHFASFLGFASLTSFLVKHGADLDARDRNGFTPLHFAAISRSSSCASILVEAGADLAVVNVLGKTSKEIAVPGFFDDILPTEESDWQSSTDEDGDLGDAEDEDQQVHRVIRRRNLRRTSRLNVLRSPGKNTPRRSADVSRAPTPSPSLDDKTSKGDAPTREDTDAADAKRAASFMEKMFHRTLAQFPAPQGIIPQLPLPHLPHLPDLPWGALPQIPLVFPVFVPVMPGWPSFLGGDHAVAVNADIPKDEGDDASKNMGNLALRAAQEWRTTWEKWVALVIATTPPQQTEDLPPPVYTPRAAESGSGQVSQETLPQVTEALASTSTRPCPSEIRPLGYDSAPVPEQVIESFGATKPTQKLEKKHDRMLLLFWLPILLLSMLWAFHNGVRFAFHAIKLALPVRTPLHS